ncbi:hypothetical protein VE25_04950 [Devosia geojensis]|uniref:CENP-V/GFA domain-containing protein n=1 Tax=Devosia geojensis TaxID=443610 RepID=A0A0F5FVJ4_9HYPH|nr:GFA family protein [Devosia geojensis]KKB12906.1 hypothetical protein VE25_04950 [Devosia geojensis]
MTEEEWTGGCMCGAIRYRAFGPPVRIEICHCRTCRRNTGSAFGVFVLFEGDKAVIEGEENLTSYRSSPPATRHGCRQCGTPLLNRFEGYVDFHLGTLDEAERLRPDTEIWTARRLPWLPLVGEVQCYLYGPDGPQL